jgi:hypothetical protein
LAAGQGHVRARNADIAKILEEPSPFSSADDLDAGASAGETLQFVGGGDGSMVLDHEVVFVSVFSFSIGYEQIF